MTYQSDKFSDHGNHRDFHFLAERVKVLFLGIVITLRLRTEEFLKFVLSVTLSSSRHEAVTP
jgi:hypothetical protein